ncbi:hypothetical protein NFI96_003550 [Prochilodus magdalenae]|nr:hypothetical protein NFI96_003550 [Prochilodus magdalenae]
MKWFERLVLHHIRAVVPPTFDPHQFAYKANRSTEDAITTALHTAPGDDALVDFKKPFQYDLQSRKQTWLRMQMMDNNTNASQKRSNTTWKDSETLKMTVKNDLPANVQLKLSHTHQKDSKVGILVSLEGANKDSVNKTGGSSLPSQLELDKNMKDEPNDSNPSIAKDMKEAKKEPEALTMPVKVDPPANVHLDSTPTSNMAKDVEGAKKESEALKVPVKDDPSANVQLDLSKTNQKDLKIQNKTGGSSLPSQLELTKNVKDEPKDSKPSIPDKNELKPNQTKEDNIVTVKSKLEHQGQINNSKDQDRSKTEPQSNQTGLKTDKKSTNISTSGSPVLNKLTPIPVMFKKSFKKMPDWETNDVYLKSDEPAPMVCPESLHKTKDLDFQKAYIPNIQMYLYKNLLNLSEWNRLARFNNPFGFMEYNYSEIKSAVDLIPKPKVSQLLPLPEKDSCIRCAVVANGGILNGSKMGKEIDSHQYVFRMNGAVTAGHEEDVGNKTSVYVHTAFSLVASLISFKKYGFKNIPKDEGIKYVMIPEGLRDFYWLQGLLSGQEVLKGEFKKRKPWTYYGNQFDENRFYVLHPDFLRYIRNRFMHSKQQNGTRWAMYRPTNGAFTLFLALHVCDTVDAYGFITETHRNYPNYYYENKMTRVIFFANHDYNLEIKLWKKLHDAKIINLYQREEGRT